MQERKAAAAPAPLDGLVHLPPARLRRLLLGLPAPPRRRRRLAPERRPDRRRTLRRPVARGPGHAPADGPVALEPALGLGAHPGRRLHRRGQGPERHDARGALQGRRYRPEPQRPAGRRGRPLSLPRPPGRPREPGPDRSRSRAIPSSRSPSSTSWSRSAKRARPTALKKLIDGGELTPEVKTRAEQGLKQITI
ncbi:MAG: hypothetical protein MZV64_52700 [Ignavibacteriales bacterium]|nr:hypothetical protein [Ignavibacteriales bacterium]